MPGKDKKEGKKKKKSKKELEQGWFHERDGYFKSAVWKSPPLRNTSKRGVFSIHIVFH
jgi:hypothetical protein